MRRLLAQWSVVCAPASSAPLNEQLAALLDWRDAVALSQALTPPLGCVPATGLVDGAAQFAALDRLRKQLLADFNDTRLVRGGDAPSPRQNAPHLADIASVDSATALRLHHAAQQRAMASRIGAFREQLRQRLRETTPQGAQVAAIDEVLAHALAEREQRTLAALPSMLARRAAVLRAADPGGTQNTPEAWPPQGWRAQLWDELQRALHAELELRLQPVLGLLEALCPEPAAHPATTPPAP